MHSAPLPVVSNRENFEDEEECPVCLEPLSFSFRLPGEKPHIVPECGHALHEVRVICPTDMYILLTLSRPVLLLYTVHLRIKAVQLFLEKLTWVFAAFVVGL